MSGKTISLADVRHSFAPHRPGAAPVEVLRPTTTEVRSEQFVALLGPSGCGKTTVLNMVAGFEPVSSGDIRIDGRPIAGPAADRGVVFQGDDSLYPWLTALGNVEFGRRRC